MMLFMFVYASQLKLIDERLFQSEQYTWLKTLDHVSKLSTLTSERQYLLYSRHAVKILIKQAHGPISPFILRMENIEF